MEELAVNVDPLVMVDGPLDRFEGLHDNLSCQETVLLIVTLKFPRFISEEVVDLLLTQVLDALLNPLAPHLAGHAVVEVLDQGLLGPVQPVAQVVVVVEGVVDLLDLLLADEDLVVEHDVAEAHVGVTQVLGVTAGQLEVLKTGDQALDPLSRGRLPGSKALGQGLDVEAGYPAVDELEVGHLDHVVFAQLRQHLVDVVVEELIG